MAALNISQFTHIGSVAAINRETIEFNDGLDSYYAHHATKYPQQSEVVDWCRRNTVPWNIVIPLAICNDTPRIDTNFGILQTISRFFAVLCNIDVKKFRTYFLKFCAFIERRINASSGFFFLTIEKPVCTVNK